MSQLPRWSTSGLLMIVLTAVSSPTSSAEAPPDDPVGRWRLTCVSPDGKNRDCVVVISRHGNTLKGIYLADGQARSAKNVSLERGILSVQVDGRFVGQTYTLTYKGKPAGAAYCGTVYWSYGWASGQFEFEGERLIEAVTAVP